MSFGDFMGWCLAFLLPIFTMAGPLRRDQAAAQAYLLAVLLHIAAAAVYFYFPGILPVRADANLFHWYAQYYATTPGTTELSFAVGSHFFRQYLTVVYSLIEPSFFLGAILSIYAFALSVIVLAKFMELVNVRQGKGLAILLFGAVPASVLYGSVPMREPYQVLFFMLACYSMLRFRLTNQPLHLVAAIVFAFLMGTFHKGLIVYAPFLIAIMLLVRVDDARSRSRGRVHLHRLTAVALAMVFLTWASGAAQQLQGVPGLGILLSATTGEDMVELAVGHRDEEALSKGRTAYGVALNASSPIQFVYSAVLIFFYYMFTPFPWQVRGPMDIYGFGEVILRIACLVAIFRMWRRGGPVHPQIVTMLMVVYFSMAFLWAVGTTNYGTAIRHHMVHQWILLVLGLPALLRTRSGFAGVRPMAQRAGPQGFARSLGTPAEPRILHLRSLTGTSAPPRRLARQPGGLQVAAAAPRLLVRGLGRPRRLTEE